MAEAFYEPEGDSYVATELTRGPWDPGSQHAGPPAALIGRELERLGGGRIGGTTDRRRSSGASPTRCCGRCRSRRCGSRPRCVRPGRRVEMVAATLSDEEGE